MVRAVLDANVYVSAAVRAEGPPEQIIETFLRGRSFEIVMSQAIVDAVLRALTYPKVRKYIRPRLDPELWFEDIVVLCQLVAGQHEFAGVSKDPDDDEDIAAAIEGRAQFVVAGDSDVLDLKEYGASASLARGRSWMSSPVRSSRESSPKSRRALGRRIAQHLRR